MISRKKMAPHDTIMTGYETEGGKYIYSVVTEVLLKR